MPWGRLPGGRGIHGARKEARVGVLAWDSTSGRGWTRRGQPGRGSRARCRPAAAAAASPSTPTPPAAGKGGQGFPGHPQTGRTRRGDGGPEA